MNRDRFPGLADGWARLDGPGGTQMVDYAIDAMTEWMRSGRTANEGGAFPHAQASEEVVVAARDAASFDACSLDVRCRVISWWENEGVYGLNAAIYSRDTKRARIIARQVKCGTVNINEAYGATFGSIDLPMGGMRESGMGRRQGAEGILRYTETQSVAVQKLIRFGPMFGMSDESYAKFMTASLRIMDKLGRA